LPEPRRAAIEAGRRLRADADLDLGTIVRIAGSAGAFFDLGDARRPGLGHLRAVVRDRRGSESKESSFASGDVRAARSIPDGVEIAYHAPSAREGGWRLLRARVRCLVEAAPGPALVIHFEIANATDAPVEVRDLALAIPGEGEAAHFHPFVAGHGTILRWARRDGRGDDLLAIAGPGTAPEEFSRAEGEIYLCSRGAREKEWTADGPNDHRSLALSPGESRAFSLRFHAVADDFERERILLSSGKLSIRVVPGPVLPRDLEARVRIATDVPIRAMETLEGGTTIETVGKREKGQIFRVRVEGEGRRRVRVHYGRDEWTQVTLLATAPLRDLLVARARFVAEHQRCLDPDDAMKRKGAFLPYDAARGSIVFEDARADLVSGRGAVGAAEPLFLARKTRAIPDPREIDCLEAFAARHVLPAARAGRLEAEWGEHLPFVAETLRILASIRGGAGGETGDLEALANEWLPPAAPPADRARIRAALPDAPSFECGGLVPARSIEGGAKTLADALVEDPAGRFADAAYGAILAPFGLIEESGVAHAAYDSEPSRRGFDPLSGEAALSFADAMRGLATISVDDKELGPIGYGGVLERRFDDWRVIPRDGLRKSVIFVPLAIRVRIDAGDLAEVLAFESRDRISVTIACERVPPSRTRIEIEGLKDGDYAIAGAGGAPIRARCEKGRLVAEGLPLVPGVRRLEIRTA